jgi:hypothetical protein
VTCAHCGYAAKHHSYQERRVLTAHGPVRVRRAYYYCGRCHQSFLPYDDAVGLVDEISPGLRPLVCLAGTLAPFADAAEDVLRRFAGVRLSASTVLRTTEGEGERLRAQLKEGRVVAPARAEPAWTGPRDDADAGGPEEERPDLAPRVELRERGELTAVAEGLRHDSDEGHLVPQLVLFLHPAVAEVTGEGRAEEGAAGDEEAQAHLHLGPALRTLRAGLPLRRAGTRFRPWLRLGVGHLFPAGLVLLAVGRRGPAGGRCGGAFLPALRLGRGRAGRFGWFSQSIRIRRLGLGQGRRGPEHGLAPRAADGLAEHRLGDLQLLAAFVANNEGAHGLSGGGRAGRNRRVESPTESPRRGSECGELASNRRSGQRNENREFSAGATSTAAILPTVSSRASARRTSTTQESMRPLNIEYVWYIGA